MNERHLIDNEVEKERLARHRAETRAFWFSWGFFTEEENRLMTAINMNPLLAVEPFETLEGDPEVNCHAHALRLDGWFEPGYELWPERIPKTRTLFDYAGAFACFGCEVAPSVDPEPGFDRVAFYFKDGFATHTALQLPDGRWESKLGKFFIIRGHSLRALEGPAFGRVAFVARRKL